MSMGKFKNMNLCFKFFLSTRRNRLFIAVSKMTLNPRESGEFIIKKAKFVKVHNENIDKLKNIIINAIKDEKLHIDNFSQHDLHPSCTDSHAVDWIFLVDTLNFCFWTPGDDTKWRVNDYTGYFALCAAINRAVSEGIDITNPKVYAKITVTELTNILRPDDGITFPPLIEERVQCLHEVGQKLLEKYNGKFENCIKSCKNTAQKLLNLIVTEFPCFRDEANYMDKRVSMYKRAQILIGDIWSCYRGKDLGFFNDIQTITMFADYRVPQVLVHFGTLEYKSELLDYLQKNEIMSNGDEREVEIRGASIYIVEELKRKIIDEIESKRMKEISNSNVNSILLDHFLWDYRRKHAKELEHIPFHKVLSIFY